MLCSKCNCANITLLLMSVFITKNRIVGNKKCLIFLSRSIKLGKLKEWEFLGYQSSIVKSGFITFRRIVM